MTYTWIEHKPSKPWGCGSRAGPGIEPVEITTADALQQRIKQGGVITITRGTFAVPTAHLPDCPALKQIRIPTAHTRYWWTPDFGTAATNLGARKCEHCLRPRRYPSPFRPRR